MKSKNIRKKRILFAGLLLFFLLANVFLSNLIFNDNSYINDNDNDNENDYIRNDFQDNDLKKQDLSSDSSYSGIGAPWNVSHWANRTDNNLPVEFTSSSYDDSQSIPLKQGWEGYQLNATIKELYETRNWVNGTFNAGNDDGDSSCPEDDSDYLQNWTFGYRDISGGGDPPYENAMSGNYFDSGNTLVPGYDVLELRMNGDNDGYDRLDACWWNTNITIPRGNVIDGEISIAVYPWSQYHDEATLGNGDYGSHWLFQIRMNDVLIDAKNLIELENLGNGGWVNYQYPLTKWLDDPLIFPDPIEGNKINLTLRLIRLGATLAYADYGDFQQIFIDNVSLELKTEVKPEQIGLKLNGTDVEDIDWSKGRVGVEGSWNNPNQNTDVSANFNCDKVWPLGDYDVELKTDLSLFTRGFNQGSYYEQDLNSVGTYFEVKNNSIINWETNGHISLLDNYEETNMSLQFPKDVNITWVSSNQEPAINILNKCDNSTPGLLEIPVKNITSLPSGYWLFKGVSPNYCEDLNIYNNVTGIWELNSTLLSGDYLNITAKITKSSIIQNYIDETYAHLYIRFPNGTIWTDQIQSVKLDSNGIVKFSSFRIPYISGSDYKAGKYEAIVTWNNSYSIYGLNESGVISKEFTIIHESILQPEDGIYFIENVINNTVINIKVRFKDKIDDSNIRNAKVYALDPSALKLDFSESSPGLYLLIFDASQYVTGNVTLRVFANSTSYINKQINITVDVIEETLLIVDSLGDFVQFEQNFTIRFNYTRKNNPSNEIIITDFDKEVSTSFTGQYQIIKNPDNSYNFTCNSTGYTPNVYHTFNFTVNVYKFEAQTSSQIPFLITELDSKMVLYVNSTKFNPNDVYSVEAWQKINITAVYKDINDNSILGANVTVKGTQGFEANLTYKSQYKHYTAIVNVSDLAEGIDLLNVYAESINYRANNIPFIVQISENQTMMEIFANGVNITKDLSYEIWIDSIIHITVNYTTTNGIHLGGSMLKLLGDYSANLTETSNYYEYTLDTKDLGIGVYIIHLTAEKTNFESQDENLRIVVRKIKTQILIDDDTIEIDPGEDAKLEIELFDLDNNIRIRGMIVQYDWKLKDGDFDETPDGLYEAKLKEVPEGSYTITISVTDLTGKYNFIEIEITLDASGEPEEPLFWLILFIIAGLIGAALATYIIAYQLYFKYPKPVRKVRKYRKTLKKRSAPKTDILSRDKAFSQTFSDKTKSIPKLKALEKPILPIATEKKLKSTIEKSKEKPKKQLKEKTKK